MEGLDVSKATGEGIISWKVAVLNNQLPVLEELRNMRGFMLNEIGSWTRVNH